MQSTQVVVDYPNTYFACHWDWSLSRPLTSHPITKRKLNQILTTYVWGVVACSWHMQPSVPTDVIHCSGKLGHLTGSWYTSVRWKNGIICWWKLVAPLVLVKRTRTRGHQFWNVVAILWQDSDYVVTFRSLSYLCHYTYRLQNYVSVPC